MDWKSIEPQMQGFSPLSMIKTNFKLKMSGRVRERETS